MFSAITKGPITPWELRFCSLGRFSIFTQVIYTFLSRSLRALYTVSFCFLYWSFQPLLFKAIMKLVQLQWKSLINKNLPSLMVYVYKNQCQLFHISNGIIWLTIWITLVHLNSFRSLNLLLHLICLSFENTLFIKHTF